LYIEAGQVGPASYSTVLALQDSVQHADVNSLIKILSKVSHSVNYPGGIG
jgi:hypothetical protein